MKTHFEHIIGGSAEEREKAAEELQRLFMTRIKSLEKYELTKTERDIEIIEKTEHMVDEVVRHYGHEPKPLPLHNIYILPPGSLLTITEGEIAGGVYKAFPLAIGVERDEDFLFASTIAHELFHLKSYVSARVHDTSGDTHLFRTGLQMIDRKDSDRKSGEEKKFFSLLEESIVAESTRRLMQKMNNAELFDEEIQAMQKIKEILVHKGANKNIPPEKLEEFIREIKYIPRATKWLHDILQYSSNESDQQMYGAGVLHGLQDRRAIVYWERYDERKKLYELLDSIVEKSHGKFQNRDEVFDIFATANFSGKYLPLARIIEEILGEGAFRKLAHEFAKDPKEKNNPPSIM